jgi:hypothetical protein
MRQATDNGTITLALPALGFIWGLGLSVWWLGRRARRGRR